MRKMFVVGLVLFMSACMPIYGAKAQGISTFIAKLPVTNAGVYYNINDSLFEFTSTFRALSYKGINLNIGYATPESLVTNLSYEIIRLEKFGIEIPVLKDIVLDAGWTIGWEEPLNDREFSNGPSVTLKIKW